ncbi:hypothetical protein DRN74_02665 [Candidatus Micrarchaeota archaeon]|nr:MAG: hypothetical protein DRN74_02665 [Candidatus Micrarchaeota archaeon]
METVRKTAERIRAIKIQGATNIAIAGLKAIRHIDEKDLDKAVRILSRARPNEPLLFNGLNFVKSASVKMSIKDAVDEFISMIKEAKRKAVINCASKIPDKSSIMTHCHSSLVVESIIEAKRIGKKPNVIVTETRPLYQGRITAKELASEGIPVKFIIDSAAMEFMAEVDFFLMGGDVITANNCIMNKIGTAMMAKIAHDYGKKVGAVVELLKIDASKSKRDIKIEQRKASEVWRNAPKKIKIMNPAFDLTPAKFIDFVSTELGNLNAYTLFAVAEKKYPWLTEARKWY